jgi:hypothetical protein
MTDDAPAKTDRAAYRSLRQSVFSALLLFLFVALTMWWVKQQFPNAVPVVAVILAIICMGGSLLISRRHERHLDEVQIAGQGFAMTKGCLYGAMATILLLALPPTANWLIDLVDLPVSGTFDAGARRGVHMAFVFGACLVVLLQVLVAGVVSAVWWRRTK